MALVGAPAALLPSGLGSLDLACLLAWTAWVGPAVGAWCGARSRSLAPIALGAAGWLLLGAACVWFGPQRQASPSLGVASAGLAVGVGGMLLGHGLGARWPRRALVVGHATVLVAVLGSGLSVGLGRIPTSPETTAPTRGALLLDLAPSTLACEAAGIDWMRHPRIYEPAGTDWFSGRRRPYGSLAGVAALVVGFALGMAVRGRPDGGDSSLPVSPDD